MTLGPNLGTYLLLLFYMALLWVLTLALYILANKLCVVVGPLGQNRDIRWAYRVYIGARAALVVVSICVLALMLVTVCLS